MIKVSHDKEPKWMPAEKCAFCKTPTRYWFTQKDVAVCQSCATKVAAENVPSKREWLNSHGANLPENWECNADRKNCS